MKISLKAARVNAGLKQEDIAEQLGIHVQTYQRIERNSDMATVEQAKKISAIVGVSYEDIFFGQ